MVGQWLCLMGAKAGASTKDSTHHRRAGCEGRKVMLNISMKLQLKMNDFLCNKYNEQRFIGLLGEHLAMRGCDIPLAVKVSDTCEAVMGDDTDPLVLMIDQADGNKPMSNSYPNQRKEQHSGARELI